MSNKESYLLSGLFTVLFMGLGLLTAIIFTFHIPLSLLVGALVGYIISLIIDYVIKLTRNKK
jgi:hypothetical protein